MDLKRFALNAAAFSLGRLCACWMLLSVCGYAQKPGGPLSLAPRQWASEAAANETKVLAYGGNYVRYRMHVQDAKGDLVRDVYESKDGPVARLILKDGRALTAEEDAAEHERLQAMLDSPGAYAKHVRNEASGKKYAMELMAQMPDAMIYTYVAGQPQRPGHSGEIVMDYTPNPAWTAPSMACDALTGLRGRLWIDGSTHFLTRMEGHIFQPVNMGLVLAKIYPGGELTFEQSQVIPTRYLFTSFDEHVTVRAMMVKTIRENTRVEGTQHTQVPPTSYQDAIRILLATPLPH